jgi:myo-inositol-1(or 4)-monophosphatase
VTLPDAVDLQSELALALRLADAARPIALAHFRSPLAIEHKSDHSPVTIADRAIETELRRLIQEHFPTHAILGEEYGSSPGTEFTWVLDPIDGTKSFITGVPLFGTLIALLHGQQPVLGIIDIPATGERWLGQHGRQSLFDAKPARVSGCASIESARICTTSPDMFDAEGWRRFDALSRRAAFRRFGGDCYIYGLLASGHCDLVIEMGLQPYDYLAMVPVIEGAGGRISDWSGQPLGLYSDGRVVAAASEQLWHQAIKELT